MGMRVDMITGKMQAEIGIIRSLYLSLFESRVPHLKAEQPRYQLVSKITVLMSSGITTIKKN